MSRTALITGGSRRIGAAIARHLAREGWRIVIQSRQENEDLSALLSDIETAGGLAKPVYADLTSENACKALINQSADLFDGSLDLLVNNASVFENDTIEDASWAQFDKHMAVHVKAPMTLSQGFAALAQTDAEAADRLIVNIIDQRVWRLNPHYTTYTLSKSALWTLTQTLAQALAPAVRVNGIGPGPTLPNDFQDPSDFDGEAANVPLAKATPPADIAKAISFLWASKSMTGQMLALDGGQHLAWATPDVLSGGAAGN